MLARSNAAFPSFRLPFANGSHLQFRLVAVAGPGPDLQLPEPSHVLTNPPHDRLEKPVRRASLAPGNLITKKPLLFAGWYHFPPL